MILGVKQKILLQVRVKLARVKLGIQLQKTVGQSVNRSWVRVQVDRNRHPRQAESFVATFSVGQDFYIRCLVITIHRV